MWTHKDMKEKKKKKKKKMMMIYLEESWEFWS
jgi:hypothetical protein